MENSLQMQQLFAQSIETKQSCLEQDFASLYHMGDIITQCIQDGNKVMLFQYHLGSMWEG